jgi:glycosyltransferase involved in cell wall biosynthesis
MMKAALLRYLAFILVIAGLVFAVIAASWLSIVPLRLGGGTRLKILESMALGTPVISTSKGAEGLDISDGTNILLADHPDEFARKIIALLNDPALRTTLSENGKHLVRLKYDWDSIGKKLRAVVSTCSDEARKVDDLR